MKVKFYNGGLKITKEITDKKYYSESVLLYQIKKELQKQGYDVIKKLMYKDGHLTSDTEHYIRDRKGDYAFYFNDYAVRFSYEDFNNGELLLMGIGNTPK
jgi:hypothetical protein